LSQFPKPPVKGTYDETLPSPRMKFNERDAASVAATTFLTQPIIVIASAIESMAVNVDGMVSSATPSMSMSFATAWLTQTIAVALLKTVACFLRNHGGSFFRDFVAWVWRWWVLAAWDAMRESARAILPRRRSTPVRPRPDSPQPPSPGRRKPVRDAIRRRRGDQ
jgi:hypothetical protein